MDDLIKMTRPKGTKNKQKLQPKFKKEKVAETSKVDVMKELDRLNKLRVTEFENKLSELVKQYHITYDEAYDTIENINL